LSAPLYFKEKLIPSGTAKASRITSKVDGDTPEDSLPQFRAFDNSEASSIGWTFDEACAVMEHGLLALQQTLYGKL
jgi:hypothetical protein